MSQSRVGFNDRATSDKRGSAVLIFVLVASCVVYAALAWQFPLPSLIGRGRVTIGTATNRSTIAAVALALVGGTLYALYLAGALLLWRRPPAQARPMVWIGAIGASLLLLWTYPVTSTDIFDYVFRARMAVVYGANPYLDLPNQFKSDPFSRYIGWPNAPSAYGPLWELVSALLPRFGSASLASQVELYKLVAIAAFLGCGMVIEKLVQPRLRPLALYLWLMSPLPLWEFAAIGHNDGLLVLSLLLALFFVQRDRYAWAVLALVGGALFKFLPIVFAPLVVLAWMRRKPTWRQRVGVALLALLLGALPTIILYAPYWDLPANFVQLSFGDQVRAIWTGRTTTLHNVAVREGFLNAAPLAVISYLLQTPVSVDTINSLVGPLGFAPAKNDIRAAVSSVGSALLAMGLVWQCWHVWFRRRALQAAFWGLLLWYLLVSSQWFQPWYVVWPLAIMALNPDRSRVAWLTAWAMMAQASYLLQYFVLPNIKLSGQTLQAQVYYLVVIYLAPLLVWLLMEPWANNKRERSLLAPEA